MDLEIHERAQWRGPPAYLLRSMETLDFGRQPGELSQGLSPKKLNGRIW